MATTKTEYQVATFWYRTGARILDIILISIVSFALSLLFFIHSPFTVNDFFHRWNGVQEIQGWRVLLLMLFLYMFELAYFVLLPTFWRGQTLFKRAFGIRVVSADPRRRFFWQIFKRESLLWMLLSWAGIITGIIATCVHDPMQLFAAVFNFAVVTTNQTHEQIVNGYLATFIRTLYAIGGMIPALMAIYMVAFKKKRALQDIIGNDYVVFTKHHDANTWNRLLLKKQLNQGQIETKEKIFEPFIDWDTSKYPARWKLVANLKEHYSSDDQPLPGRSLPTVSETAPTTDFSKDSKPEGSTWYDAV